MIAKKANKTRLTGAMKEALLDDACCTLYDPDLRKAMQLAKTSAEYQIETFLRGDQLVDQVAKDLVNAYNVEMVTFQDVRLPQYVNAVDASGEKPITIQAYAPHDGTPYFDRVDIVYKRMNWSIKLKNTVTLPKIGKYEDCFYGGTSSRTGWTTPIRLSINNSRSGELSILPSNPMINHQVLEAYRATYRYEKDAIALIKNFRLLLRAAKNVEMVQDFYPRAKDICAPFEVTPDLPAFIDTALLDRMKGMKFDRVKLAA